VEGGTQTSYVVTLYTKMAPPALESAMVTSLVKISRHETGICRPGFSGTPFLPVYAWGKPRTSRRGIPFVAEWRLISFWGYMLSKGATTWWERWNGDTGDPAMNSYNHYAVWVRGGVGLSFSCRYRRDSTAPGYHQVVIHPRLDGRIQHARGEYESVYGKIVSDWTGSPAGPFSLQGHHPANTTAAYICRAFQMRV